VDIGVYFYRALRLLIYFIHHFLLFLLFWRGGRGCNSRIGEWGMKLSLRVLGDEEVAMSVFDIGIRFFYMLQYFNHSAFLVFLVSLAIL
jgi:hypothetical protein